MEEAPENGKELSRSAHVNGMNEWILETQPTNKDVVCCIKTRRGKILGNLAVSRIDHMNYTEVEIRHCTYTHLANTILHADNLHVNRRWPLTTMDQICWPISRTECMHILAMACAFLPSTLEVETTTVDNKSTWGCHLYSVTLLVHVQGGYKLVALPRTTDHLVYQLV